QSARIGFSAALTELLKAFPAISTDFAEGLMASELTGKAAAASGARGGGNRQERKDAAFGRIFGTAVLQRYTVYPCRNRPRFAHFALGTQVGSSASHRFECGGGRGRSARAACRSVAKRG